MTKRTPAKEMPALRAKIVHMHDRQKKSFAEIGRIIKMTPSSVANHYRKARDIMALESFKPKAINKYDALLCAPVNSGKTYAEYLEIAGIKKPKLEKEELST